MIRNYKSGNVVICNYINFKGEIKKGLFVVLYNELYDNLNNNEKNFMAVKITTQLDMVGNYTVNLNLDENPFFKYPCLACCSKIHTLHKNQIEGVLGKLSENTFKKVYVSYSKFISEVNRQMMSEL